MNCKLTVLMAVYNGVPFLRTAIESILNQTYRDFRFLIVDDASTDESREIVWSYDDDRIQLVRLERNMGQTAALNIGLRHAKTPWIARMDADDYSAPTRLEEQMAALEEDPSLSCLGTFCWGFRSDANVVEAIYKHPTRNEDIKRWRLTGCPMTHGSLIVARKALLDIGAYDERYRVAADIELYERLLERYRAANLPRALYGCRIYPGQRQWSRLGLEESIDIWRRRLAQNRCNAEEASLIRDTLARHILRRVGVLLAERNIPASARDLCWAFRLSPVLVARSYCGMLRRFLLQVPSRADKSPGQPD